MLETGFPVVAVSLIVGRWASALSRPVVVLVTTVRTVVAVTVEQSLDELESPSSSEHLPLPPAPPPCWSFHVLTVDDATMSANVSVAVTVDDRLTASD